ncbi:MAG: hypothetical protein IKI75_02605 [Lachnospiraceae bacterium]|nr:hypothetical protein [Lachnospiraceae bacterium]
MSLVGPRPIQTTNKEIEEYRLMLITVVAL